MFQSPLNGVSNIGERAMTFAFDDNGLALEQRRIADQEPRKH